MNLKLIAKLKTSSMQIEIPNKQLIKHIKILRTEAEYKSSHIT